MADSTEMGMATSIAQEKSTISTDAALVTFRVRRYVSAAVPKVYGIRRLTSFSAWL